MASRKDSHGRVLQKGESQRSDGLYQFRYTTENGKRIAFYARTLQELRQKETKIDPVDSSMTVKELFERFLALKSGVRYNTHQSYAYYFSLLEADPIADRPIGSLRASEAKEFLLRQYKSGKAVTTMKAFHTTMKSVFKLAIEDELIKKSPFAFKLKEIVGDEANTRTALTLKEQETLLRLFTEDSYAQFSYTKFVILLDTGIRVSELCAIAVDDIDFEQKRLRISKQYAKVGATAYELTVPKTKTSMRVLPLTDRAVAAFKMEVESRHLTGTDFIFTAATGELLRGTAVDREFERLRKHLETVYGIDIFFTPHVLRHTYCTNMLSKGIDVKALQYLMGHSAAQITLDTYGHADAEYAERAVQALTTPILHQLS